jgi:hypothetical protein
LVLKRFASVVKCGDDLIAFRGENEMRISDPQTLTNICISGALL